MGLLTNADPALTARARHSIGVLPLVAVRVQQELMKATTARGHAGLKMSHGEVLPLIGPEGARIHEIARIQHVSRQAISATSRDLEALRYLRREPDPCDRRGVILRLTDSGTRLIRDSVAALDGLERSFRDILGTRRLEQLRRGARDLHQALHLEEESFETGPERQGAPDGRGNQPVQADRRDIRGLATTLRRQLGGRDAARLAELLEPRAGGTAT
jgi:DNA-binding MarR family transcriptional regulator